jgi:transcriptional regulator with XRE-family HTH domain
MDKKQLIKMLWVLVEKEGSQKQLADKLKVSPAYLNDVLNEKRDPGESILKPLGLRKVVRYE